MLREDEPLRREFEKARTENPELFNSQWAMLNWFYSKTPWWDQRKDIYPVGRVMQQLTYGQ